MSTLLDSFTHAIDIEAHLQPYLGLTGWVRQSRGNNRWSIWHGPLRADGNPFEMVFPINRAAEDRPSYIRKAIEFLSMLHKETAERIALRVINYDRDVLFIRNLETDSEVALPLMRAVEQITGLQRMFIAAASAEYDPKPFFTRATAAARREARGFQFGHTLPGSFVFTVSAPKLPARSTVQLQLRLEDDDTLDSENLSRLVAMPFARRISERVARGLKSSHEADQRKDYTVLLDEYRSGFTANMCRAMLDVAADGNARVELQVAWSPKLPAAKDIADLEPVQIDREDCSTLEYVAEQLKDVKPEPVTIQGNIRGLLTNNNPGLATSRRAVILHGTNPTTNHRASFVVELSMDDYTRALEAHRNWDTVQVTGIPSRSGDGWRISTAEDFRVFPSI